MDEDEPYCDTKYYNTLSRCAFDAQRQYGSIAFFFDNTLYDVKIV